MNSSPHPKKFACDKCDKSYEKRRYLQVHYDAVHNGKTFPCHKCDKAFTRNSSLHEHVRSAHIGIRFPCDQCDKNFTSKRYLRDHVTGVHLNLRPFKCKICSKAFKSTANLFTHSKTHNQVSQQDLPSPQLSHESEKAANTSQSFLSDDEEPPAMIFRFRPDNPEQLTEEVTLQSVNSVMDETVSSISSTAKPQSNRPFKCDICDRSFSLKSHVELHARKRHHNKPNKKSQSASAVKVYQCGICSQTFLKLYHLTEHVDKAHTVKKTTEIKGNLKETITTTEKPVTNDKKQMIRCDNCDLTFAARSELKLHQRKQHRNKFACDKCGKSFYRNAYLKAHISIVHMGEKPFQCELCDKSYVQNTDLKLHVDAVHKGIRYKCEQCEKSFLKPRYLKSHVNIVHEGIRLKCDVCDKNFTHPHYLKSHVDSVHRGIRKYKCQKCFRAFKQRHTLKLHLKKLHGISKTFQCDNCDAKFSRKEFLVGHKHRIHGEKNVREENPAVIKLKQELF